MIDNSGSIASFGLGKPAAMIPYYTAMAGAGVSLRLKAVQITKLVEGGAGAGAKGHGFDEIKDGYVAPQEPMEVDEVQEASDF